MFKKFSLMKDYRPENRSRSLKLIGEFLTLMIITGIILTVILKNAESGITWEEAIWQVWQTASTVGYGNNPASSSIGRWSVMIFGMLMIAFMGVTVGTIFDYREERKSKRRFGLLDNPFKNGIVIFNFPGISKFLDFERELRAMEPDTGICIVDDKIQELPQSLTMLPNIHFIKGSILLEKTFEKARLKENRIVIVFPDNFSSPQSDAATRMVVGLLKNFTADMTRIIYILVDQRNSWMFRDLDANSTSILDNLEILALVQECQDIYSAPTIQMLLSNIEGPNPLTVKPGRIAGWKWGDFQVKSAVTAKTLGMKMNTLALIRNSIPDSCPGYDEVIKMGDYISVVTYDNFRWDIFEQELVKQGGFSIEQDLPMAAEA
jgi:voltage-gated potassium channel